MIFICWWKIMKLHFIKCNRDLSTWQKSSKTANDLYSFKFQAKKNCKTINGWCAFCTIKILQQMSGHPYVHLCWSQLVIQLFSTGSHIIFTDFKHPFSSPFLHRCMHPHPNASMHTHAHMCAHTHTQICIHLFISSSIHPSSNICLVK